MIGARIAAGEFGLRILADHDGGFFILSAGARHYAHFLPKLFGDEGDDRVSQTQHRFKHRDQGVARGALLSIIAVSKLHLGKLQVPVAVLIPNEGVDGVGGVIQAPFGKRFFHLCDRAVQFTQNPFVHKGQFLRQRSI